MYVENNFVKVKRFVCVAIERESPREGEKRWKEAGKCGAEPIGCKSRRQLRGETLPAEDSNKKVEPWSTISHAPTLDLAETETETETRTPKDRRPAALSLFLSLSLSFALSLVSCLVVSSLAPAFYFYFFLLLSDGGNSLLMSFSQPNRLLSRCCCSCSLS